MTDDNTRMVINTIAEDGVLITLVPVTDIPESSIPKPITKEFVDNQIKNGTHYAVVETKVFDILMNLGVSPNWYLDNKGKPIFWNPGTERNHYVVRLVADARADEQVSCIDGNNLNLRSFNLEKTKKTFNPAKRDRQDITKSEYTQTFKTLNTYTNYGQPQYVYN